MLPGASVKIGDGLTDLAAILSYQQRWEEALLIAEQSVGQLTGYDASVWQDLSRIRSWLAVANAVAVRAGIRMKIGIERDDASTAKLALGDFQLLNDLINRGAADLMALDRPADLDSLIQGLRRGIYSYPYARAAGTQNRTLGIRSRNEYIQCAQALYQLLVAPAGDHLREKLTIIPDGNLGYIPFEALLNGPLQRLNSIQAYPYLIRHHQVSYAYSGSILAAVKQQSEPAELIDEILVMAPFNMRGYGYTLNTSGTADGGTPLYLPALPYSDEEVAAVLRSWPGKALRDTMATAGRFELLAPAYRIVHLATHGVTDDQDSDLTFLAFAADDRPLFFALKIYDLELYADLIFLSACQTGTGALQPGEGIMSLSRAFTFAGATSLVSSLWKVPDDPAGVAIMAEFYTLLRRGESKDAALRQAKLSYLNGHIGEKALPFFWASFILYGDTGPMY